MTPPNVSNPADNLKNLFEIPILFYGGGGGGGRGGGWL